MTEPKDKGLPAWMVHNRVTPNLLMIFFLVGGFFMSTRIKQEVFPEFDLDTVTIRVPYPGAGPEEVEQGIVLAVEEAVRGIDGVKEISATASQGSGVVRVELEENADGQKIYQELRQAVDRINTFPIDAEDPEISLDVRRMGVVDLQVFGRVDAGTLRNQAEDIRDRLLQHPGITQVDLRGARDPEVLVSVSAERLRAHGLTLEQVAATLRSSAVELPAGGVKTDGGEILVRFNERRDWAREFADLPLIQSPEGVVLRLGEVAEVEETFEDSEDEATFEGMPSIGIRIMRVGRETPIGVSDAVREVLENMQGEIPEGLYTAINNDRSDIYRQRLELLLKNAFMGLVLVLVTLGLFLEFKLAFWVTMGIPVSFLGAMLFLPLMGVSINMISMFAFIIALGIVVDDAIVAGENIYEYRQKGMTHLEAAIQGTKDVSIPIAFSILTNVAAFLPLAFIPGMMGKTWGVVPAVVITVFLISWLESLLILPSHLAHTRSEPSSGVTAWLHRGQQAFSRKLGVFIEKVYGPFLDFALRHRLLFLSIGLATLFGILGYVKGGHIGFVLMPRVEADESVVTAVLPYGSPIENLRSVRDHLENAARSITRDPALAHLIEGVYSEIEGNRVQVTAYMVPVERRTLPTREFTQRWREASGSVPGLVSLLFEADRGGPGSGAALTIELTHRDIAILDAASSALAERLTEFANVKDIDSGYSPGKAQFDLALSDSGRALGLTSASVARQVRDALTGGEAIRQQRGRNELTVRVRLPEEERSRASDIENLLVRTPAGRDVPLREIATLRSNRAYTTITRREGRRTVSVKANVEPVGETGQVQATLNETVLPQLLADFPGLSAGYEGRQADMKESSKAMFQGMLFALGAIYFLLAIPFKSYTQPLIVMLTIPFGIVGAVLGHMMMGYTLSIISVMGMIALSGVSVNDALILIEYANRLRAENDQGPFEAMHQAGVRRFRPILLTTLTTFFGLAPMIFETSRQARFMIPMAISLGYGILFATAISLILVPCLYVVIDDISRLFGKTAQDLSTSQSNGEPHS
jgi:multidrug efflux pump subunit AcrB